MLTSPLSWTIPTPPFEAPLGGSESWDARYGAKGAGRALDSQEWVMDPVSKRGVRFSSGQYQYEEVDLVASINGLQLGHTRCYANRLTEGSGDYRHGWLVKELKRLSFADWNSTSERIICVVDSASSSQFFQWAGTDLYRPVFAGFDELYHDSYEGEYILRTSKGMQWGFFDHNHGSALAGRLKYILDPYGRRTEAVYDGDYLVEIGDGDESALQYTYLTHDVIESVTLRVDGNDVRRARYEYWDNASDGADLKFAIVEEWSPRTEEWETVRTSYYRYHDEGSTGRRGLKDIVRGVAYRKIEGWLDPDTATDEDVAPYANVRLQYDGDGRVTTLDVNGAEDPLERYEYEYHETEDDPELDDVNTWSTLTIETGPCGVERSIYANRAGQVLVSRRRLAGSGTSPEWFEQARYNSRFQIVRVASPSAIESVTLPAFPGNMDLDVSLKEHEGLVRYREYYRDDDEETGAVAGYLKAVGVRKGKWGDRVRLRRYSYDSHEAFGYRIHPVRSERVYSEEDRCAKTSYEYAWHEDGAAPTHQIQGWTVVHPEVDEDHNGTGEEEFSEEIYDTLGLPTWSRSPRGIATRWTYDPVRLVPVRRIDDADTSSATDAPSGWDSRSGRNLRSDFAYDGYGRLTRSLAPAIEIDPGTVGASGTAPIEVRPARFGAYDPAARHAWHAEGYLRMDGSGEEWRILGPVTWELSDTNGDGVDEVVQTRGPESSVSDPDDFAASGSLPDMEDWVRRTRHRLDRWGRVDRERVYSVISLSALESDSTYFEYNAMGLLERVELPSDTITRYVYDARELCVEVWVGKNDSDATSSDPSGDGHSENNMKAVRLVEYDHGQGGGDGLPTAIVHPLDDSESRVEYLAHDYRHRRVESYIQTGDAGIAYGYRYDDRDMLVERERFHVSSPVPPIPPLVPLSAKVFGSEACPCPCPPPSVPRRTHSTKFYYDARGRAYRRREYGIDALGDTAGSVDEESWYDPDGNLIKLRDMAAAVTKFRYDSLGRLRATYLAVESGSTRTGNTNRVADDTVIEETRYKYNDAGHLVAQKSCARFDDADGQGRLRRQSEPRSRNSYVARYCDPLGRLCFLADFGTNGGDSWNRPDLHPEPSDSILVTEHAYGYDGLLRKTVDPGGNETRWRRDHAGRLVEERKGSYASSDDSQIVRYEYNENKLYRMICVNQGEEEQVSHWGYSTHLETSDIASWNLVTRKASPTGKEEYYFYNRQGEVKKFVDANGTVHEYVRDGAGRLIHDRVTTLASGVDGKVRRISRTYDDRGLLKLVTSHDDKDVGEGRVVNEVAFYYNEYGMLVREVQSHWGDRYHVDAREVGYTYETDGTTGAVRRTGVTYPSDKAIQYQYSSDSIGDAINRVRTVTGPARGDGTGTGIVLAQFDYLGASVPAVADFPEPGLQHSWKMQPGESEEDAGDPYTGYDRFGRTVRSRWLRPGSSSLPHVDVSWGYDRRSNKVWRRDLVAPDLAPSPVPEHDQRAEYDALSRITGWKRGMLDLLTFDIASPAEQEAFGYDHPGNWTSYRRHVGGTLEIDQSRVHNESNQIVEVDGDGSKLAYDDNGNMTKYPSGRDLDGSVRPLRWDAWNRLRRIQSSAGDWLAWFGYDGLGRRIYREDNPTISDFDRHYFYDDRWQVIEEGWHESDSNGDAIPGTLRAVGQYVWHPDARGQLILRDRSTENDSNFDERRYALRDELDVVAIADYDGGVLERYAYTPFGVHTIMDAGYGERSGNDSDYEWNALFHGHFQDQIGSYAVTSLYCIGHRYYRPKLGRWLSQDPAGYVDGPNLYAYVGQNPWNFIDPTGLLKLGASRELVFNTNWANDLRRHGNAMLSALKSIWTDLRNAPGDIADAVLHPIATGGAMVQAVKDFNENVGSYEIYGTQTPEEFYKGVITGAAGLMGGVALSNTSRIVRMAPGGSGGRVVRANVAKSGGRGLIGVVRAGGTVDGSLGAVYLSLAQSSQFASNVSRYNRIAGWLGQTKIGSVDEVVGALKADTTFSRTGNLRAGLFTSGQHSASTQFWLQGNPLSAYGGRAGRHELLHMGAALRGQSDAWLHEVAVQAASTPENLLIGGGILVGGGAGGYYLSK